MHEKFASDLAVTVPAPRAAAVVSSAGVLHRPRALTRLSPALLPAALWLWVFCHLHNEWTLNPQYHYGWAVPFLAGLLFYFRWESRPAPEARSKLFVVDLGIASLLFLLLPLRIIEEANPDWRVVSWSLASIAAAVSLLQLARIGGTAWARHFAFPICLALVAVPWPVQFENAVVQTLTRAVAYAAVEIAGWLGLGAFQIGNVIELHNGLVGVNEACSGVKTLQSAIMVALVLGELLLLRGNCRLVLLVAGCAWVFACNVARATALVTIAARNGTGALEHWHDTIGTLVLVVGTGGLMAIAWLLRHELVATSEPKFVRDRRNIRATPALVSLAWLVVVFGGTELWYRGHEQQLVQLPSWQVRWPNESNAQPLSIPTETRAMLRYHDAQSVAAQTSDGARWWSFFARWEPQRAALQLVRSHSPEICLPAVGRVFRGELAPITVDTDAMTLPFRAYQFEENGRPLFVFVCVQEDKAGPERGVVPNEWNTAGRLRAAWSGERNLGQRLLEIAVVGYDDFPRAREAFAKTVSAMVVRA